MFLVFGIYYMSFMIIAKKYPHGILPNLSSF